jgi:hypothetical protein
MKPIGNSFHLINEKERLREENDFQEVNQQSNLPVDIFPIHIFRAA